tara:strand:+ start:236 stop:442 length:207 start_codon:yes stop_codon:yes gene_type:complete
MENKYILHTKRAIVDLQDVEFLTWRQNDDNGEWWVKLHLPSGKEIRLVYKTYEEMQEIIELWEDARGE